MPAPAEVPALSGGSPLSPAIQARLERTLGTDLRLVRVHDDSQSQLMAAKMSARAFTIGNHIFLGRGEDPNDLSLMAHEAAHVVQQQAAPEVQRYGGASDRFEREADQTSAVAQRGGIAAVQERTGGARVQKGVLEGGAAWLRDQALSLLEEGAPELLPILRQGVIEWLKERLGSMVRSMMEMMARPVRTISDLVSSLRRHFASLVGWLREAGAKIARNDCTPISEAAEKIHQVFEGLAAPVVDRVKHYASTVKEFFLGLWRRFDASVLDVLRSVGGAIWEQIQRVGRWFWEKTQPIRDWLSSAWRSFKNWLGIGEGEEGQNGVLQWFQRKASEAWEWVSARIAPYKRQILIVIGIVALLSPAGPLILIGAEVGAVLRGIQWIRQNLRRRGAVVEQRNVLRGVILPAVLGAIDRVSGVVNRIAAAITGALGRVVGALDEMTATVAGIPLLSFASGLMGFVASAFRGLLEWATEGVQGVAASLQSGLQSLGGFARTLVDFLERVGAAVANVMRLAHALGGRVWNAIPSCIRDPFIDFFIPLILRQIPFFRELGASPEAWQRTRADITDLIRQVFQDFDLMGAIRSAFRLVVRALRIPVDLALQVLEKGAQAFDLVMAAPLRFIENSLKAVLRGVGFFMRNFLSNLWFGVQGWLLNAIEQSGTGIRPPASFSFRDIFVFVLDVLGISLDHVLDLLARRVGRPIVTRIRQAINILTGVWEWVKVAIEEGPAGLWRMVVDRLGNLARTVIESAVGWVMTRIIAIVGARLTALAASAGLSGIIEAVVAVYQAVQTAIEYARRILQIMLTVFNTVIQIAQGVIDPAARGVEQGLRLAMPVVIGFLANYAGLGGIGGRIREIVLAVRERVDAAILSLIDRALAAGRWLLERLRAGAQAVLSWWRQRKQFRARNGRQHTIFYRGDERSAQIMVATAETPLTTLLASIQAAVNAPANEAQRTANEPLLELLRQRVLEIAAVETRLKNGTSTNLQQDYDELSLKAFGDRENVSLSKLLEPLLPLLDAADIPEAVLPPFVNGVKANSFEALFIGNSTPTGQNSDAHSGNLPGWSELTAFIDPDVNKSIRERDTYVKMHLLHERWGRATDSNLTPARSLINNPFAHHEHQAIGDADGPRKKVLWYATAIQYHRPDAGPVRTIDYSKYPEFVRSEFGYYEQNNGTWSRGVSIRNFDPGRIPHPDFQRGIARVFDINSEGHRTLRAIDVGRPENHPYPRLTPGFTTYMRDVRRRRLGARDPESGARIWTEIPFTSFNDFKMRMRERHDRNPGTPPDFEQGMEFIEEAHRQGKILPA